MGPGGGGGRVVIDPGAGVFTATGGTIDVSGGSGGSPSTFLGGPGGGPGGAGVVTVVPEPMSLVMVGTGGLVLLGYGWRRRRRATA